MAGLWSTIPPTHTVSGQHAIFPRIVSIVRVSGFTTRYSEATIGSLLEVEGSETIGSFDRQKVSLAFDFALAFDHAGERNRGGILRPLILANHLQTHHVFATNRYHRFILPCDALILQNRVSASQQKKIQSKIHDPKRFSSTIWHDICMIPIGGFSVFQRDCKTFRKKPGTVLLSRHQ